MNNLNYLREQNGLSYRALETCVGIDKAMLVQLEKGKVKLTEMRIDTFCQFYKVSSDFLLGKSDFGIYLNLSSGFITLNKADYESYKLKGLINEYIFNNEIMRTAKNELEDLVDPLYNKDLKEQINNELDKLSQKQLEKVLTLIKEVIK